MGERLKMNYSRTSSRFKTRIGGCITILITLLGLASLILISAQYFDTSSPVVTTSLELLRSAQSMNIYGKELISGYSVGFNSVYEPLKMNTYMTIKGQLIERTFDPTTNSIKTEVSKEFGYIPCSYLKDGDPAKELVRKLIAAADIRIIICPNFEDAGNDVTLSSDSENLSSSYLSIKIYPCSLPNKNECRPVTQIFGAEVTLAEILNRLSPSEYDNPVVLSWIHPRYVIDITRTKSFRYSLQQNKIIDDRHFFRKPEIKAEFGTFTHTATDNWPRDMTQLYCSTAMIDDGECEEYFDFVYEMGNDVKIVTRRYKKIPVLMGEAGGVLKLLTSVFVLVSLFYSRLIKSFIFRQVFRTKLETLVQMKQIINREERKSLGDVQDDEKRKKENLRKLGKIKGKQKNVENSADVEAQAKESIREEVDSKIDIVELVKKMKLVDLLSKASLKQNHRILLPLVLLTKKQSQEEKPGRSLRQDQRFAPQMTRQAPRTGKGLFSKKEVPDEDLNSSSNQTSERDRQQFRECKRIYQGLKEVTPKNSIERICSQQILSTLSLIFEEE